MTSLTATERGSAFLLAALLAAALLAGCAAPSASDVPAEQVTAAMAAAQPDLELFSAGPSDENFAALLERVYGIDPETVQDGRVLYADGISANEIAALRFGSAAEAGEAVRALADYAARRAAEFTGYAPDQAAIAGQARTVQDSTWALLIMLPDPGAAEAAASALLSGKTPASAPPASTSSAPAETASAQMAADAYDHDAVLAALASGSPEGLGEQNRRVYEAVRAVLTAEIRDDMTPYEKELAIHDWMTEHIQYDPAELSHPLAGAVPTPDNDNPIGALLAGRAICYGYSTTFQLFMDALGIPCITIEGEANYPAEPHSWNAVKLDGQWYYVDVTWDDPTTGVPDHDYLNQTTAYLEEHGPHIWERDGLPEIAAEPYRAA